MTQCIIILLQFKLFINQKFPFSKSMNGYELSASSNCSLSSSSKFLFLDDLKYFLLRSFEDLLSNDLESLPLVFQKIRRVLKFIMKLNFVISSDYLRLSDIICTNKTELLQDDNSNFYDRIFVSRQELFSLSHVSICLFIFIYLFLTIYRNC